MPKILGMIGDDLYLVEIDGNSREHVLLELVDRYEVDERSLRIEIVFFGDAGGVFASSMHFLEHWPKSPADVPADVFVDNHCKAAFTKAGDEVFMSVRHALRPSDGPPRRCAVGSWGGQRPGLGGYVTGTGVTSGVLAAGGR